MTLRDTRLIPDSKGIAARFCAVGDSVIDHNIYLDRLFTGGNSYNFAILCKKLGFDSAFMGVVGDDSYGRLIQTTLAQSDVDISYIETREGETGLCKIDLIDGDRVITDINDLGVLKSDPFRISDKAMSFIQTYDLVHSGCYSFMEPEFPRMNQLGIPILYDASDKWSEASLQTRSKDVDYLFFSGKDLALDDLERILRSLVGQDQCKIAITTVGDRGAMVYDGSQLHSIKPYFATAPIVDSTGSGDYWITGFITTWIQGLKYWEHFEREPKIQGDWKAKPEDRADYLGKLMDYAISSANVMARFACMHEGSFGIGFPMES